MSKKIILFSILLLAFFLRFYRLATYPAINADEAAIGYNAFSLIETGRDEHGNPWPIHFQSFNDYKPGLYFYLVLPLVKFIGLNAWSVRIPGAFLGVMTVYVLYLLIEELRIASSLKFGKWDLSTSEIAAFFLAISPWHIHFSRGGWEVNVATFFIVLGLWLFIKGMRDLVYLFLSVLAFALSLYTYHAARVVVPLLGLGLLLIYKDELKKSIRNLLFAGLLGLVAVLPLAIDMLNPQIASRAAGVGIFADPGPVARINEQRGEHGDYTSITAKILHNKAVNYSLAFLENWSEHYHGLFLFVSGDVIQRNAVPETGQMYLFDVIFVLAGLTSIIAGWKKFTFSKKRGWKLFIWWLLIAPVAAALTFQSPHALRAQNMVIPLVILSAYGLNNIIQFIRLPQGGKGRPPLGWARLDTLGIFVILGLIIWNFARYEHMYWVHMAKDYPYSSQYGVEQLVAYLEKRKSEFNKIIVTDRYDQPYILFLYYLKYPPEKFQKEHTLTERDEFGFSTVRRFDKYAFASIDLDKMLVDDPDSLLVGNDAEIPDEANVVKEIYGTNGYKYFEVVAN